jgi:hypothetical protein
MGKKITAFVIGLALAVAVVEVVLRLFLSCYVSLTKPAPELEKLKRLYWVYGSFLLDKYVSYDMVCGFIPRAGFFRGPRETVPGVANRHLYPYSDYCTYDKEKKEDVRIICLGDSTTYGDSYVGAYPYQLQQLLRDAFPHKNITVLNAGLCSSSSKQLKRIFQFYLADYKPDILIWRKGAELTDGYAVSVSRFNVVRYNLWRCMHYLRVFRVLCIMRDMNKRLPIHTTREAVHSFIKERLTLDDFLHNYMRRSARDDSGLSFNSDFEIVKKIASEHGTTQVVAVDYVMLRDQGLESDCAAYKSKGIQPVICTMQAFQDKLASSPSGEIFEDHCHLTRLGSGIVAHEIFDFLMKEKVLEKVWGSQDSL